MKTFLGIMIAVQLLAVPGGVEMTCPQESEAIVMEAQSNAGLMRVEEFKWYYRDYNGECQRRLWSVTYGYWVTDWLPCNT